MPFILGCNNFMNDNPKCLVAVPTYGRPQFLPRVLACFKRLNYDNKKLVIINDDPECRYFIEPDKDIEIVNIDTHLSLAVKRNLFPSWDFDIMFPLDDDDLFMPNRLKNHVVQYQSDSELDLYRNKSNIIINRKKIGKGGVASFTNSSFTRTGYFKSFGYTNYDQSNYDDVTLRANFRKRCNLKIEKDWNFCDFIYQFDQGRFHNSWNRAEMIDDRFVKASSKFKKSGDILLDIDYDTYDNIYNLSMEVLEKNNPINITLNDERTKVTRVP